MGVEVALRWMAAWVRDMIRLTFVAQPPRLENPDSQGAIARHRWRSTNGGVARPAGASYARTGGGPQSCQRQRSVTLGRPAGGLGGHAQTDMSEA